MSEPLLYKPEDAARVLGLGRSKVYELMASGELESVQIGRSRRVPRASCERLVERLRAAKASTSAA